MLQSLAIATSAIAAVQSTTVQAKDEADGHLVIVWHVDAREPWVGRGADPTKLQAVLLKHCAKAMKAECKVAISVSNGAVVYGQMANGNAAMMYSANSLAEARTALAAECRKQETECEIQREYQAPFAANKPSYELPKISPALYRRYGAVVWQRQVTAPVRVWTATGRRTADLAKGDALAKCRADTGGECVVAQSGSGSAMVVFTENNTGLAVVQERSQEKARQVIKDLCAKRKLTCKVQAIINSGVEETAVHTISL
jgi:uncharacterized protein YaaQ